jgi:tRNA modification GTPase
LISLIRSSLRRPSHGALAIVRVAGPQAHRMARHIVQTWPPTPREATLTKLHDPAGRELDQSIVIRYDAPASFTGEDAVEIMTHGGLVVPTTVVAAFIARGARLALPGEFSRRAVLNGKLDLLQAEAAGDLVNATSRAAQSTALRQLDGGLSRRLLTLRDDLIGLEALIAYDIDFPEEDDGPIAPARILDATESLIKDLEQLLSTSRIGEMVREGALVVLAGAPNVGKSSLFNALLGQSRAIVTDLPGTTRDAIEAVIDTPTVPLRLVDTAGMRQSTDAVERIGVEISAAYVARAAVVLACADSAETIALISAALGPIAVAPIIGVWTKADVHPFADKDLAAFGDLERARSTISVSAETGDGLDDLLSAIVGVIASGATTREADAPVLTHTRHRFAVSFALGEIRAFRQAWQEGSVPAPVAAVHLRSAATALEDLIGGVDVDQILDEVFRRFCVGK